MSVGMRRLFLLATLLLAGACSSTEKEPDIAVPYEDELKKELEQQGDEKGQLIRRTYQNVRRYDELRIDAQDQPMTAMRRTIGRTVDDDFKTFDEYARDTEAVNRHWAVACLGFAIEKHAAARKTLESMLLEENQPNWLLANECQALATLADKDTDLSLVIPLVGYGDPEVRACAATAIKEIWRVRTTPRELTPEHYAAIDRLVALLHDKATTRGRRAAVWALAYLHHPDVLDQLIAALEDDDTWVQIGALRGIEMLGDARAFEPLFDYLDSNPAEGPLSYCLRALQQIAVQNGFAKTKTELEGLGSSAKTWRKWLKGERSK